MKPSNVARRTRPKAAPLPNSGRRQSASPGKKREAALHGRVDSGMAEPAKPWAAGGGTKAAPRSRHARVDGNGAPVSPGAKSAAKRALSGKPGGGGGGAGGVSGGTGRRGAAPVETTRTRAAAEPQSRSAALEAKLAEREAQVRAELRAGQEALELELKAAKDQLWEEQDARAVAEAGLMGARSGSKAVHAAKAQAEGKVVEAERQIDELRTAVAAEQARLHDVEAGHAAAAKQFAERNEQWAALEAELEFERSNSRELLAAQEALERAVTEHQQARSEAEAEAARHKEERTRAEQDKDKAEQRARARQREMGILRLDMGTQVKKEQKALSDMENECASLKGRLKAANSHINRLKRERDGVRGEQGADIRTLQQTNEKLSEQVAEMEAQCEAAQNLAETMRAQVAQTLETERARLTALDEERRAAAQDTETSLRAQIDELADTLEATDRRLRFESNRVLELEAKRASLEKALRLARMKSTTGSSPASTPRGGSSSGGNGGSTGKTKRGAVEVTVGSPLRSPSGRGGRAGRGRGGLNVSSPRRGAGEGGRPLSSPKSPGGRRRQQAPGSGSKAKAAAAAERMAAAEQAAREEGALLEEQANLQRELQQAREHAANREDQLDEQRQAQAEAEAHAQAQAEYSSNLRSSQELNSLRGSGGLLDTVRARLSADMDRAAAATAAMSEEETKEEEAAASAAAEQPWQTEHEQAQEEEYLRLRRQEHDRGRDSSGAAAAAAHAAGVGPYMAGTQQSSLQVQLPVKALMDIDEGGAASHHRLDSPPPEILGGAVGGEGLRSYGHHNHHRDVRTGMMPPGSAGGGTALDGSSSSIGTGGTGGSRPPSADPASEQQIVYYNNWKLATSTNGDGIPMAETSAEYQRSSLGGSSAASLPEGATMVFDPGYGRAVRGSGGGGGVGGGIVGRDNDGAMHGEMRVEWSSDDEREGAAAPAPPGSEQQETEEAHAQAQEAIREADRFLARQRERVAVYGGAAVATRSFDSVDSMEQTRRTLERYGGGGGDHHHDEATEDGGSVTQSMMAEEREAEAEISRQISAAMHVGGEGAISAHSAAAAGGGQHGAMARDALHGGVPFDSLTQEQMQMRLEIERRTAEVHAPSSHPLLLDDSRSTARNYWLADRPAAFGKASPVHLTTSPPQIG